MNRFFPMRRAERAALVGLAGFSALAFLPPVAEVSVFGVSLFGWLMALLLAGSPLLLLGLLRPEAAREDAREPAEKTGEDAAPPPGGEGAGPPP